MPIERERNVVHSRRSEMRRLKSAPPSCPAEFASIQPQIRVADVDSGLPGNTEAGIDFVESAVGATDDAGIEEHGEVLGNAGRSRIQTLGNLNHGQGFALCEFTEDRPTAFATDGGKNFFEGKAWRRRFAGSLRGI